jgi:hypothetical protein
MSVDRDLIWVILFTAKEALECYYFNYSGSNNLDLLDGFMEKMVQEDA